MALSAVTSRSSEHREHREHREQRPGWQDLAGAVVDGCDSYDSYGIPWYICPSLHRVKGPLPSWSRVRAREFATYAHPPGDVALWQHE